MRRARGAVACRTATASRLRSRLTFAVGALVGLVNATAVDKLGIPAFIVTLAGLQVYRGLALLVSGGMTVAGLPQSIKDFARGSLFGAPNLFLTMLAVALVVHYMLGYTRTGRYLYALGSNAEAARRQGIPVFRIVVTAYVLSACLATLGGVLAGRAPQRRFAFDGKRV